MQIASFFAGAGGLDLGFRQAGFSIPWANEYDKAIHPTYEANHFGTTLERRSLFDFEPDQVPKGVLGMIGGPPCQSWSEAGKARGADDKRGQLFFRYVDFVETVRPVFFLAENVSGILFNRHSSSLKNILERFCELGYNVSYGLLNANDYGVPQDRERVIIVGYRLERSTFFIPPTQDSEQRNLKDAIFDLRKTAKPAKSKTYANSRLRIPNHEYLDTTYSSMFMSRNRVRAWDEPSFTIQAGGRHAPLHPSAPKMVVIERDKRAFVENEFYRRLTVREAARIQTFPDDFIFHYKNVLDGYKMIGNAVPVEFGRRLAMQIASDIRLSQALPRTSRRKGRLKTFDELIFSHQEAVA
jgi:DNA (cytosine-5)-methyltransferase 1